MASEGLSHCAFRFLCHLASCHHPESFFSLNNQGDAQREGDVSLRWYLTASAEYAVPLYLSLMSWLGVKPYWLAYSILADQAIVKMKWQVLEGIHFLSLNMCPLAICSIRAETWRFAEINLNGCWFQVGSNKSFGQKGGMQVAWTVYTVYNRNVYEPNSCLKVNDKQMRNNLGFGIICVQFYLYKEKLCIRTKM